MSLAWDQSLGKGLLVGAEDVCITLALRPPSSPTAESTPTTAAHPTANSLPANGEPLAAVCGGGEKMAELWSLEAVKVRKVTNPGLGIVRKEVVQYLTVVRAFS
jgi:hypothetical protein